MNDKPNIFKSLLICALDIGSYFPTCLDFPSLRNCFCLWSHFHFYYVNYLLRLLYFSSIQSFHLACFLYCTDDGTSIQGWRQGRAIAPHRSMLAPRRKVKSDFFGDFWHLWYPKNYISAPSSEESVPRRKIPGATPASIVSKCVLTKWYSIVF